MAGMILIISAERETTFKGSIISNLIVWVRELDGEDHLLRKFILLFSWDGDHWRSTHRTTFTGIDSSYALPDNNAAILTLQDLGDKSDLLRLAHLYEVGEDKDLSNIASGELRRLFPGKQIGKVRERSLPANQERSEMEKKRLVWQVEGGQGEESKVLRGRPVDPTKLVVNIAPPEAAFAWRGLPAENDKVLGCSSPAVISVTVELRAWHVVQKNKG